MNDQESGIEEDTQRDETAVLPEPVSAELAYARADAWARSAPGTPYGSTVATRGESST